MLFLPNVNGCYLTNAQLAFHCHGRSDYRYLVSILSNLLFGCCSQELFNVIRRCKAVLNYSGYFRTQGEAIVSEIFKGYQAFTKVSHSNMFLVYFSLGL